jgi:hypothetical protein
VEATPEIPGDGGHATIANDASLRTRPSSLSRVKRPVPARRVWPARLLHYRRSIMTQKYSPLPAAHAISPQQARDGATGSRLEGDQRRLRTTRTRISASAPVAAASPIPRWRVASGHPAAERPIAAALTCSPSPPLTGVTSRRSSAVRGSPSHVVGDVRGS